MSENTSKKKAAPKKVYFTAESEDGKSKQKYQITGKRFCFQGTKYTAEEAAKAPELLECLVRDQSPAITKV